MKFGRYLAESQRRQEFMSTGDTFGVLVNEELALEFDVMYHNSEIALIEADEVAMAILESCGCTFEEELEEGIKDSRLQHMPYFEKLKQDVKDMEPAVQEYLLTINDPYGDVWKQSYYSFWKGEDAREQVQMAIAKKYGVDPELLHKAEMRRRARSLNSRINEAEYQGRDVKLGKPMRGDVKKYKVYVKNKKGNVVKVNFGDPNMQIRRDNPEARKNFRARHGCGTPRASDRTKAAYWSCRMWSSKPVSKILKGK